MENYDYSLNFTAFPNCSTTEFVPDPSSEVFNPATKKFFLVIYIILFIICLVASLFLFYAIAVTKKTTINIFITNHSIAGLVMVFMSFLYYSVSVESRWNWTGGWLVCKTGNFAHSSLSMVISFSMVAMSVYKCKAVMNPTIEYKPNKKYVLLICLMTWCLAMFVAQPFYSMSVFYKNEHTCQNYCYLEGPHFLGSKVVSVYLVVAGLFEYFIPVAVLAITHGLMWWKLNQESSVVAVGGGYDVVGEEDGGDELKDRQQARMLTTASLIYIILFLPWYILSTIALFFVDLNINIFLHFTTISHMFEIFSVFCFPVAYFIMAPKFNEVMKGTWVWSKFCKNV
ncbi:hypothetical protein HELRODRAFT_193760 [Helobdella robusta]|uniref:G-protein coupled receptors family 1 profile domain-containing protein n=1 Tax=Helobdella robusta TaxID=6412 RepID=T1FVB9_HELRO|nr:hypothetical protein HELRODRAFT_193760 [Helobdella robusta]ESN94909.1 hypothetical protein HELRODRAFT_193760 [Helobdella robusta]